MRPITINSATFLGSLVSTFYATSHYPSLMLSLMLIVAISKPASCHCFFYRRPLRSQISGRALTAYSPTTIAFSTAVLYIHKYRDAHSPHTHQPLSLFLPPSFTFANIGTRTHRILTNASALLSHSLFTEGRSCLKLYYQSCQWWHKHGSVYGSSHK